jgi:SAM-dependent methyltransferase
MNKQRLVGTNIVYQIYESHFKKRSSYFERFASIPDTLSEEERGSWLNRDVPRLASLYDFREWIEKYQIQTGESLLYTCDTDDELKHIEYKHKHYIPYPPYDLHTLSLSKKDFDLVVFNQTLEHLYNPYLAVANLFDHLKSGGYLYTTVPTINIPHMTPIHYWGITPMGLAVMMYSCGFDICELGYWGNKKYIDYIFTKNDWADYTQVQTDGKIATDLVCQAQTWILVRKP